MGIVARMAALFQTNFGTIAEQAAEKSEVIQRKRKFTASSLAQTFVLGFLAHPNATDEQLAQTANKIGADVTTQAVEQRHSPRLVRFLKEFFLGCSKEIVASDSALAPILERFTEVGVLDSSTITLPECMKNEFPGCGGKYEHGGGNAAIKLQTELDLKHGGLKIDVESGKSSDNTSAAQMAERKEGSLRIADLGYFSLSVLATMAAAKAFFLSRLQFGTKVTLKENGNVVAIPNLLAWLGERHARHKGPFVDMSVLLGQDLAFGCRLIAWRVPAEQANRRRQKLKKDLMNKKKRVPSAERLAWCDWSILVTNVPIEKLTPAEAVVLYRARWQIELLFKRWKSQDLVATLTGSTDERKMVRVWGRLAAALLQHWLVVTTTWGNATRSWAKTSEAIRDFVGQIIDAIPERARLERVLEKLCSVVSKTCGRNKRKKPGTVELLNDASLLDFRLT